MDRFCVVPSNAALIADNQIQRAADIAGRDLAAVVNRLHKFIGAYPVSAESEETLESLKDYLIDLTWKVDEIIEANAPAPVLQAAE